MHDLRGRREGSGVPVNTIEVPKALREVVDGFVLSDPTREHGGFLFGTPLRFDTFLPVPNVAPDTRNTYKVPNNWQAFARAFSNVVGSEVVAHVHTHPSHSIPSEQDFKAGKYWFQHVRYMVLIAPNAEGGKTTWWVLDERAEVQEIVSTDDELEAASLLFARRFGFADLGPVLMAADGTLRAQGRIPQALLENADARTLYTAILGSKRRLDTKKALQEISGLSGPRVTAALEILDEAGLATQSQFSRRFTATDIFGRRFG